MFPNDNSPSAEEGITISKRQASVLVALFLLLALSVFIIGYFLGKKSMLDSLSDNFEQEIEKFDQPTVKAEGLNGAPDVSSINQDFALDDSEKEEMSTLTKEVTQVEPVKEAPVPVKAYAQLIGFGSKQSAISFKNRLAKKDIKVIIKTRSSKTAKGRKRYWYQAVTPIFNSFEKLEATIKKIQKLEFIRTKDINIVHIKEQEDQV